MRIIFLITTALFCLTISAQQKAPLLIENGSYFDGEKFIAFEAIELIDGKITQVSISDPLPSSMDYYYIDAKGKYLIPGLIDCHVHLQGHPGGEKAVRQSFNSHSALRAGVTTQLDLFSSKYGEMGRMAEVFPQYFGTVFNAGPCITVPGGHGANMGSPAQITSVDEAEEWAEKLCNDSNIDFIKIIYQYHSNKKAMKPEQMKKIVEVAHKHNKKVLAHIDHTLDAMDCAKAGVDVLAHIPLKKMTKAEVAELKKTGVAVIPTITVYQATYEGLGKDYASDSLLYASVHPNHITDFNSSGVEKQSKKEYWPFEVDFMHNLKLLIEVGVPILAGTDAGNYATFYGYAIHNEIAQYVAKGMTPAQALKTATHNVDAVFPEKKVGKIAAGYQADLVILNANPLEKIENTKQIHMVINRGVELKVMPFER